MLFAGWDVMIEKNCALGLCKQDLGHSFSQYTPPGQQITYIYCAH